MQKYSVTEFIEYLNAAFSAAVFPHGVAVEGEVAEYRVSQGKWIWFLLKDEQGVLSCFATTWKLRLPLEDGMQVRVIGQAKVHPKSGKFSLNVERVEPVGEGALRRAYELLKKNLEHEGLFAPERKRSLPRFPARIGLIASRESAAYSDFLRILGNRWGGVEVNSVHAQVQGREAVTTIVEAFEYFNAHPELADVLVLTRGGGSLEDLHAFNSEEVARAVFKSDIPVVVGVGHERDESLADYVADVRASTPSNAAEIVVPDRSEFAVELESRSSRLLGCMDSELAARRSRVDRALHLLERSITATLSSFRERWHDFREAFLRFSQSVERQSVQCATLRTRLITASDNRLARLRRDLQSQERLLETLNPRTVLQRGYAVVRAGGQAVRSAAQLKLKQEIEIELNRGQVTATVTAKKEK